MRNLAVFFILGTYLCAITLTPGWNLIGSIVNNNANNLNKSCIDYMWKWDNSEKKWEFYSSQFEVEGLDTITSIGKEEGFWVKANNYCNFDTNTTLSVVAPVDINVTPTSNKQVGINLDSVAYWSGNWPTLDLFKRSSGWITSTGEVWDTGETMLLNLDENGWIIDYSGEHNFIFAQVNVWLGNSGHLVDDQFVVTYEGEGTITYHLGCELVSQTDGRDIIRPTYESGETCVLHLDETDPNGTGKYIKNISIVPDGGICGNNYYTVAETSSECDNGDFRHFETLAGELDFHPKFLSDLKHFHGVRFMDWMHTYHNLAKTYDDLNHEEYYNWSSYDATSVAKNMPLAIQVKLVNLLKVDGWFNIPVQMDDDGIKKIGEFLRDNVDSDLKIYIEYGNEIWNYAGAFSEQNNWVQAQADTQFANNITDSGFTKRINWFGYKNNQVCGILKEVFSGDDRLICAAGTQGSNPWVGETQLACPLYGGGCHTNIDAIAVAPYFGGYLGDEGLAGVVQEMSVEEGLSELQNGGLYTADWSQVNSTKEWDDITYFIQKYYEIGQTYGVDVVGYEGGQHLAGLGAAESNSAINALFDGINKDPKMGEMYKDYLDMWFDNGGHMMMLYNDHRVYNKYGRWGLKEHQDENSSAKFDAVKEYIKDLE